MPDPSRALEEREREALCAVQGRFTTCPTDAALIEQGFLAARDLYLAAVQQPEGHAKDCAVWDSRQPYGTPACTCEFERQQPEREGKPQIERESHAQTLRALREALGLADTAEARAAEAERERDAERLRANVFTRERDWYKRDAEALDRSLALRTEALRAADWLIECLERISTALPSERTVVRGLAEAKASYAAARAALDEKGEGDGG